MPKSSRLIIVAILFLMSQPASADVSELQCGKSQCTVEISGQLSRNDVSRLAAVILEHKSTFPRVPLLLFSLDSLGGDIAAAIDMGRIMRANEAWGFVRLDRVCASACVLVLAGASTRTTLGDVVIHRPYSTFVGARPTSEIQAERTRLRTAIRNYLEEVNVSSLLLELMDSVPPERGRLLTKDEIEFFGFNGTDPVLQEKQDASWA